MPTSKDPLAAFTIGATLRDCVLERMDELGIERPPRACVVPGAVAWDNCECGQLTVAIANTFPIANFPTPSENTQATFSQSRCGQPLLGIEFNVTMLRCTPVGPDDDTPPSCEDLEDSAAAITLDAFAVRAGVTCCLLGLRDFRDEQGFPFIQDFSIRAQSYVGPAGMCGGTNLNLLVGILNSCYCS